MIENAADRTAYESLLSKFNGSIRENIELSEFTYFKIGGKADLFCETGDPDLLSKIYSEANSLGIKIELIGGGSNLLIDDKGFRGLIVRLSSKTQPSLNGKLITAHGGLPLSSLLDFAAENSMSGLEFMTGIPGSVGGAIYMNAGAHGSTIGEVLESARILQDGEIKVVTSDYFEFSYRTSRLQKYPAVVLDVTVRVKNEEQRVILAEYNRIKAVRNEKHPGRSLACAGSYFKNLPPEKPGEWRRPAGLFLENAGAKKMKSGNAEVFEKHANMIINSGGATAHDVKKLAEMMKEAVKRNFGIILYEEVRYLDSKSGFNRE